MLSTACYLSVLVPPRFFWPAVFTSYAIPGILIFNFLLLLGLIIYKRKRAIFPALGLLLGIVFIVISFSYKSKKSSSIHGFSILSYNTRYFRTSNTYEDFSFELIDWVSTQKADIKCIQEYCTNENISELNVTQKLKVEGYNSFLFLTKGKESEHGQGLAIFSKYPFLNKGFVWKSYGSINAGMFVDVEVNEDTIRIYNIHLESMGIVLRDYKSSDQYKSKLKRLASKLKYGAEVRSDQINKLISHTQKCPYPYIICGDFNETPYGYNYFKLKKYFSNAFEEAGNGFGFSFNSILFFLRIDHHFYDPQIEAIDYQVDRSMKISDHFPVRGYYSIK